MYSITGACSEFFRKIKKNESPTTKWEADAAILNNWPSSSKAVGRNSSSCSVSILANLGVPHPDWNSAVTKAVSWKRRLMPSKRSRIARAYSHRYWKQKWVANWRALAMPDQQWFAMSMEPINSLDGRVEVEVPCPRLNNAEVAVLLYTIEERSRWGGEIADKNC